MTKFIFAAALLVGQFSWALSESYPTFNVNGVPHYLADSDDTTGVWYDSVYGYCASKGLNFSSSGGVLDSSLKPLVVLDDQGQVKEILPDNKSNTVWVITAINCN